MARFKDIYAIGFNDDVELGARTLHVQTEVVDGRQIRIRTTVHEGGRILSSDTHIAESGRDLDRIAEEAEGQHNSVVMKVAENRME